MTAAFAFIKGKVYAIGAGIMFLLVVVAKYFAAKADRAEERMKGLEAALKQKQFIADNIAEVDQEYSHRAEEARKDVAAGKVPDHLKDDQW